MKRIMALDVGEKRVGVAVSDPLGLTAQPCATLKREDPEKLLGQIKKIADERGVARIIVGIPYNIRGEEGDSAKKIREFARCLHEYTGIETDIEDERFSSAVSERIMLWADVSRKKRKGNIDKMAAAVILQGFLDRETG